MAIFTACGGSSGGGSSSDVTSNIDDDATDVSTSGFAYEVTWPKAVNASTVSGTTFYMLQTDVGAQVVKGAFDSSICAGSTDAISGELATADNGLSSTFTPTSLSGSTRYCACVTNGVAYSDGSSFSGLTGCFTTVSGYNASMTKSTVTSMTDAANDVTLTFTFLDSDGASQALTEAPTVTVSGATPTCEFSDGEQKTYVCTIGGIDGCETFTDYDVVVTGAGILDFSRSFNSADDEFDWYGTKSVAEMLEFESSDKCWTGSSGGGMSENDFEITDNDTFKFLVPASGGTQVDGSIVKAPGSSPFAMTASILTNAPPTTEGYAIIVPQIGHNITTMVMAGNMMGSEIWGLAYGPQETQAIANSTGDIADYYTQIDPLYICLVRQEDLTVKIYMAFSSDGSWTELTADNMECLSSFEGNACSDVQSDILEGVTDEGDNWYDAKIMGVTYGTSAVYQPEIGFVRFNASDIAGTYEDCPPIE
jgi:hypothetical protein